jgi:hypothetical protein
MGKQLAKCGVVYWYEQKPVDGKQEIKAKHAVRRMSKKQRTALLRSAQAEIEKEVRKLKNL